MASMLEAALVGAGLGFSLAAPPGPILAKMAFETARGRWRQGVLVGLGASVADATFFALVAFGLLTVLPSGAVLAALAGLGSLLMLFFAWRAIRAARAAPVPVAAESKDRGVADLLPGETAAVSTPTAAANTPPSASALRRLDGFPAGYALAITSPFNLAWWITSGAPFLDAYGPSLGAGFFAALLATVAASVWVFHQGAKRIARFETWVSWASAALLAGFAVWLAVTAARFAAR